MRSANPAAVPLPPIRSGISQAIAVTMPPVDRPAALPSPCGAMDGGQGRGPRQRRWPRQSKNTPRKLFGPAAQPRSAAQSTIRG